MNRRIFLRFLSAVTMKSLFSSLADAQQNQLPEGVKSRLTEVELTTGEIVPKQSFFAINSIKGTKLDYKNKDSYWEDVPSIGGRPMDVRLKAGVYLDKERVQKMVRKADQDRIWAIVLKAQNNTPEIIRIIKQYQQNQGTKVWLGPPKDTGITYDGEAKIISVKDSFRIIRPGDPFGFQDNEFIKNNKNPKDLIEALKNSGATIPVEDTLCHSLNELMGDQELYKFMKKLPRESFGLLGKGRAKVKSRTPASSKIE